MVAKTAAKGFQEGVTRRQEEKAPHWGQSSDVGRGKVPFQIIIVIIRGFPRGSVVQNQSANARDAGDNGFDSWAGKIPCTKW